MKQSRHGCIMGFKDRIQTVIQYGPFIELRKISNIDYKIFSNVFIFNIILYLSFCLLFQSWFPRSYIFWGETSWSIWSQTYHPHGNFLCVSFNYSSTQYLNKDNFLFLQNFYFPDTLFRIIFNTLFGLSTSFWFAISVRFLLGCVNCLLGVIRVSKCLRQSCEGISTFSISSVLWGCTF